MDERQFDAWARRVGEAVASRRGALRLLAGGPLAAALRWFGVADATATHYGCIHVGEPCRRRRRCCSGICDGKQGKQTCRPHHAGGCKAGWRSWPCGADHACGPPGSTCLCYTTTGRAPFCSSGFFSCRACRRDRDCVRRYGFPPGSACVVCPDACHIPGRAACFKPCGA